MVVGDRPGRRACVSVPGVVARKADAWALPADTVAVLEALDLVADAPTEGRTPEPSRRGRRPTARARAETFPREALAHGPLEVADARARAQTAGIVSRTLERAAQALGLRTTRKGLPPRQRHFWSLPDLASVDVEAAVDALFGPVDEDPSP